jgi:hypothetical protein
VNGAPDAASALGRPVQQPEVVDAARYLWGGAAGASVIVDLPDLVPVSYPAACTAWFYANTGADTQLVVHVAAAGRANGLAFSLGVGVGGSGSGCDG